MGNHGNQGVALVRPCICHALVGQHIGQNDEKCKDRIKMLCARVPPKCARVGPKLLKFALNGSEKTAEQRTAPEISHDLPIVRFG